MNKSYFTQISFAFDLAMICFFFSGFGVVFGTMLEVLMGVA